MLHRIYITYILHSCAHPHAHTLACNLEQFWEWKWRETQMKMSTDWVSNPKVLNHYHTSIIAIPHQRPKPMISQWERIEYLLQFKFRNKQLAHVEYPGEKSNGFRKFPIKHSVQVKSESVSSFVVRPFVLHRKNAMVHLWRVSRQHPLESHQYDRGKSMETMYDVSSMRYRPQFGDL